MTKRLNASSSFILRSALPLLLAASLQLVTAAQADAATAAIPFEVGATSSSDAADWTASRSDKEQPAQDNDSSSDSTSDLDDNDDSSDDVAADTSTRHNQPFSARYSPLAETFGVHPLSFSLSRSLGTVPVFLLPTQSLTCLRDRIRERAPPIPVSHRSQA